MAFVKIDNHYETKITGEHASDTNIVVGGNITNKFVPNLNFSKWNDEAWFNINFPSIVLNEKSKITNEMISQDVGGLNHKWFVFNDSRLEYEITIPAKPPKNYFTLNIDFSDGMIFAYQDTLENEYLVDPVNAKETLKQYLAKRERPSEIVGSYAVYHNKRNNKYMTGKFCHILRPKITDALGNTIWADLRIDKEAKTMTISADQAWLDNCTYPIVLDPTVTMGRETIGGTGLSEEEYIRGLYNVVGGVGTTSEMHVYLKETTTDNAHLVKCAIYVSTVDGTGIKKDETNERQDIATAAAAWYVFTFAGVAIMAVGYDLLCWNNNAGGSMQMFYDTVAGASLNDFLTYGAWPSPHGIDVQSDYNFSIHCDYITAGGDNIIKKAASYYAKMRRS